MKSSFTVISTNVLARAKETLRDKFLTRFYTQHEGEFYDLGYDEALRRIASARDEFRAHGLRPRGFVAPAWLLGDEAEHAARDAQMEYTTRLRTVCRSPLGQRISCENAGL